MMGLFPADHSYIVRELTPEQRALGDRLLADRGLTHDPFVDRDDVVAVMAEAMVVPGRIALAQSTKRRHCRVCGCGEFTACRTEVDGVEVPCSWAKPDLCTACAPFLEK